MEVTGFIYVLRLRPHSGNALFYPHGAPFQFISSGSLGFSLGLGTVVPAVFLLLYYSDSSSAPVLVLVLVLVLVTIRCSPRFVSYCIVSYRILAPLVVSCVSVSVSVFVSVRIRIRMAPRFARRTGAGGMLYVSTTTYYR